MMTIVSALFVGFIACGLLFLWPIKLSIYKKSGRILSSDEILKLVEEGDADALKLAVRTRIFLACGMALGLIFLLAKYQ